MDENRWSSQLPQALWGDQSGLEGWIVHHQHQKQLQCELVHRSQVLRHFNDQPPWRPKLLPCDLLHRGWRSLPNVRNHLLHCVHEQEGTE